MLVRVYVRFYEATGLDVRDYPTEIRIDGIALETQNCHYALPDCVYSIIAVGRTKNLFSKSIGATRIRLENTGSMVVIGCLAKLILIRFGKKIVNDYCCLSVFHSDRNKS